MKIAIFGIVLESIVYMAHYYVDNIHGCSSTLNITILSVALDFIELNSMVMIPMAIWTVPRVF